MKKVIVYRSQLLPISETFIRQQTLALRCWQPILVGEQRVLDGLDLSGLDVRLLNSKRNLLSQLRRRLCRSLAQPHWPTVQALAKIDADLFHVHFGTDAVDIWPEVRAIGLPMLVTLHGYDINIRPEWWEAGKGGERRRSYPRRLMQLAREPSVRFIAVSGAVRQQAIAFGIPEEKIVVRHIGVDATAFHPVSTPISKRRKRILFVGRLVEKKGVKYLIRAFALVRDDLPDAELVIAGDGPLLPDLAALANELGLPVHFVGALDSEAVKRQMSEARVFCLPSITADSGDAEGFGLVLLEAQACGLPVVSSARGGSTEGILENKTGFPFAERDFVELADDLKLLLSNDELASEFSKNAIKFVRSRFNLIDCTNLLEHEYDALLQAKVNNPLTMPSSS